MNPFLPKLKAQSVYVVSEKEIVNDFLKSFISKNYFNFAYQTYASTLPFAVNEL
jgi:hypothetical protein